MSAVNIFETPHGAMIFTDAAVYDMDGVMLALQRKCHVTASGMAVTGRGNAIFPHMVAKALDEHRMTIDEVEEWGEEFLERAHAAVAEKLLEQAGKALNNVWIVGWSEAAGRAKIAQWSNCPPDGCPRFKLVDIVMAPDLSAEGYQRVGKALAGSDPDHPDYAQFGLAIVKSQRFDAGSAEFGCEGKFLIGGHVLRTDVTAQGIKETIVHQWPEDQVGKRIRPVPAIDGAAKNVTALREGTYSSNIDAAVVPGIAEEFRRETEAYWERQMAG